ncbi:unnamed protein product [Adineta ricciae]|uniref:Uncharacterized protein n=1 Tax=Adineta ricciae TaxID=249248 RepID=A0A816BE68_ADIRI|nr:unnamed protein product [Adineta ricciae]
MAESRERSWCVKITSLPEDITSEELAERWKLAANRIVASTDETGHNQHVKLYDFASKDAAKEFAVWQDRTQIKSSRIRCTVIEDDREQQTAEPPRLSITTTSAHNDVNSDEFSVTRQTVQGIECRNQGKCFKYGCTARHPPGWEACEDGANCMDYYCSANHPFGRTKKCSYSQQGYRCARSTRSRPCKLLHRPINIEQCLNGDACRLWQCQDWHPKKRPKECSDGQKCWNVSCPQLHPPDRIACLMSGACKDLECKNNHPPGRSTSCDSGLACGNFYCESLHPLGWDPCEAGVKCTDPSCAHASHPPDRVLSKNGEDPNEIVLPVKFLKSPEQRNLDRQHTQLPILTIKDEFCQRLEKHRILVVKAETGSGKSTQLPQYAAEYFNGLVVCTQPRVVAAISLARRVAQEYDGTSIGRSVGYRVGIGSVPDGESRVPGTDILFTTDGALIQDSTEDHNLSNIRVLIIDEAHERSLNTDIVMGIAKSLLEKRPTDFYVVIASATINASKFMDFFGLSNDQLLQAEGRVYDVDVKYIPKKIKSIEEHAVSTLLNEYEQHKGTTLVFLPGQSEIEQAMMHFSRKIPDDCVAYPLFSALSLEEQDKVLQFVEGTNAKGRMVVFCTNIAETSLTISNTRLIIDSGLVKESRFDNNLRLLTLETRTIAKASADQRKGRAGRTAPGLCIRLYHEKDLDRDEIEPAILRASLDLVCLQLLNLMFDPLTFPFMDSPGQMAIRQSLNALKQLDCVDVDGKITRRGELFAALNVEPRFSAFLIDVYAEHEPLLNLTATIVAILSAPASIFQVGITNDERDYIRKRITDNAKNHQSDLFYFASVYDGWSRVGTDVIDLQTRKCIRCRVPCNKGNICRPCRAAYSRTHLLNNNILNTVENVRNYLIETIQKPRWHLESNTVADPNEIDIVGRNLYKYFPDCYGYFVKNGENPVDVRMHYNNTPVTIIPTSTFMQEENNNSHFIAMSVKQFPNGRIKIDQLHPFQPPATTVGNAFDLQELQSALPNVDS